MSAIVATGNIVAGAMTIVSLFSDNGQTPDQMILSELAEIRRAILEFHKDMSYRFDRVDITLSEMYTGLSRALDLIDTRLGKLDGRVADVQLALLRESQQLNRLHRNMFDYLNDLSLRSINKGVSYCLDYSLFFPSLHLSDDDYRRCQIDFVTWATSDSRDKLSTGSFTNLDDPVFSMETRAWPLAAKINLLASAMQQFGLYSFGERNKLLPNPIVWATGAEAYIKLAGDNPILYDRYSTEGIDRLIAVGEELDTFLASFTNLPGQKRQPNLQFVRNLIAGYRSRSSVLRRQIQDSEDTFMLHDAKGIKLWEGSDQSTDYIPDALAAPVPATLGTDSQNLLMLTRNFAQRIPPSVRLAEKLGLGRLNISIDIQFPERIVIGLGKADNHPFSPDLYQIRSRAFITATTRFDQIIVSKMSVVSDKQFDLCVVGDNGDCSAQQRTDSAKTIVPVHWNSNEKLDTLLESKGLDSADSKIVGGVAEIGKRVTVRIVQLRRAFYTGLLTDISGKTNLHDTAEIMSSFRDLIELYTAFVFPDTLSSDEGFRGALYGTQRIVDREAVVQSLESSSRTGSRLLFPQFFERGLNTFAAKAESRIEVLSKSQSHERNPAIESTLRRLKLLRTDYVAQ